MKKKKLNGKLNLGKKRISNLGKVNGGAPASHLTCTVTNNITCEPTQNILICTWISELYTACHCEPSWQGGCESVNIPCPITIDLNCGIESVRICEA